MMHKQLLNLLHPVPGNVFPAVQTPGADLQLALQYQLEKSQWMEPGDLFDLTSRQLRELINHAIRNVPYYGEKYKKQGIRVPKRIDADWLSTLPILERVDVQHQAGLLQARTWPQEHGNTTTLSSSGSTGKPVTVTTTSYAQLMWRAFSLREHIWHARDFSKTLAGIRYLQRGIGEYPEGGQTDNWGISESAFTTGAGLYLNVATRLNDQITWLQRKQPTYLTSFPSNLAALAQHCIDHKVRFDFLEGIRTMGETVTPDHRRLIKEAWDLECVDAYSCEEFGSLAIQCPTANHYHVQSENVHLEIVDDDGNPCAIGQPGRVLITGLHNFAMPLIRYEIGDMAVWGEPCECGRGLPVIQRILGRKRNRILLPDGRNEFPYLSMHMNYEAMTGAPPKYFQFVQKTLEKIEVRLVLDEEMTSEQQDRFTEVVQRNLGYPFEITFVYLPEIPASPTGKYETFISEIA